MSETQEQPHDKTAPVLSADPWVRKLEGCLQKYPRITLIVFGAVWGICAGIFSTLTSVADLSQICSQRQNDLLWCAVSQITLGGLVTNWTPKLALFLSGVLAVIHLLHLQELAGKKHYGMVAWLIALSCTLITI